VTAARATCAAAFLLVLLAGTRPASAQALEITIPGGVGFLVSDVSASSPGSPSPFQVAFTNSNVRASDTVVVSVKAEAPNFTGPGTAMIPASKVSWTVGAVSGGAGAPGTLSSAAYSLVYISQRNPKSASFDMAWTLAPIAAPGLRAGTHSLTVRWRIEAY
jgi:hypothetical protein